MCLTQPGPATFPFSKLPLELKSIVFTFYVEEDNFCPHDSYHHRRGAKKLGDVCREWRQIVWAIPHLWSSITIPWNIRCFRRQTIVPPKLLWAKNKDIFDLYMKNSGDLPLSIRMDLVNDYDNRTYIIPEDSELPYVLDKIKSEARRIKLLDFQYETDGEAKIPTMVRRLAKRSDFPLLETVKLQSTSVDRFCKFNLDYMFCESPMLRNLKLSSITYQPDAFAGCSHLTNLHFYHMTAGQCVNALIELPNLTHLTCEWIEHPKDSPLFRNVSSDSIKNNPFKNVSLISLRMEEPPPELDNDGISIILQSISCPSLRHLDIHARHSDNIVLEAATQFVEVSNCRLASLKLVMKKPNHHIYPLLDSIHTTVETVHLEVEGYISRWERDMISEIVERISSPSYFPNLAGIHIKQEDGPLNYSLIYNGLKKRMDDWPLEREMQCQIFEVQLRYIHSDDKEEDVASEIVEGFKDLKKSGMNVMLKADYANRHHPVLQVNKYFRKRKIRE